ncbi:MAG: 3-phosphoshikimate 1-carboxyvinyltransferase [Bacteroidetes bacterium]|nr:3-phosphoshikimate 1-carboxyvinyltransferase [Bacteroidota bacterium]
MIVEIQPSAISGTIAAPTSKSSMQRACAAALLHEGTTQINNPGKSNDDLAALDIIQHLGATITMQDDGSIAVTSSGNITPVNGTINCGESGLSIRMFTPIAALSDQSITINGTGSLLTRPMDFFDAILPKLGIEVQSNIGLLPLHIKGPLQPQPITIDGSLSSQFLTGLLMAFAKAAKEQVPITVIDLKSKPYIDLTIKVMEHFGYAVQNDNYEVFTVVPQSNIPQRISYTVEGDWSGGAFLLVAGAIAGNITVKGLDVVSTQADKAILKALSDCGCSLSIQDTQISIGPPATGVNALQAFHFNATDCPDLFPPLVALAAYCNGTTVIEGVNRLAHKESNRGLTLQEEFGKMGIAIELQGDMMMIKGGTGIKGVPVHSRHDHRIAMACAVAALQANGNTVIEKAEAVNKSYPEFYRHLEMLHAAVSLHH